MNSPLKVFINYLRALKDPTNLSREASNNITGMANFSILVIFLDLYSTCTHLLDFTFTHI